MQTACQLVENVLARSDSLCKNETEAQKNIQAVVSLIESSDKWEHQKALVMLSPGTHENSPIIEVLAAGYCPTSVVQEVACGKPDPECHLVIRFGNNWIVPGKKSIYAAVRQRTVINFDDCTTVLPFSQTLLSAIEMGASSFDSIREKEYTSALQENQLFLGLLRAALEENDFATWNSQIAKLRAVELQNGCA